MEQMQYNLMFRWFVGLVGRSVRRCGRVRRWRKVGAQGGEEQPAFTAEGLVKAAAVQARGMKQVVDGGGLVAER